VGMGVILELIFDKDMCFCTKNKLNKQYVNYFIPVLLNVLKSSLRH